MKPIAPNRNIKTKVRTLVEFKTFVKNRNYKTEAAVTLCDKKHCVFSGNMRIGSYVEAYELCRKSGINLISYEAIHTEPPKKVCLLTKEEYDKI